MHIITRSCVLFLWMHTLTLVKSQGCTLEQFLNSRLYDSNFDTTGLDTSYPGGKQVRVGCNVGYSGFFKLICVEGKWQSRGTKCQPRSCGHPGDAQFADFHLDKGDDFVFGSQVVYTCHKGYQMVSRTNLRRCMAEGWDGVVPVCEAQQCPVIHVDNNVQVIGDPEEATYGNVVRFSCKSSSEILLGSPEIYCDENGEWSDRAPKCEAIKCTVPVIENGHVPGDIQEYKENEILYFVCNPKHKPAEDRPSKCTKLGIRAEWSPTPLCEPIKCRLVLPPLQGTRYEPVSRNVFLPGDTVRVICGERYWVSNPQQISAETICQDDGRWSISPVCQEVICSNRRDQFVDYWDVYWGQRITLSETVRYRCRSGYKSTDGTNRATCTRDGWRPNPLCQEIICNRMDILHADPVGFKQRYKNNERIEYVCKDGYDGRFTLTCGRDGWNGQRQCREITCDIEHFDNADIDGNTQSVYRYNDEVHYTCKNGYEGHFTLTCGKTGWAKHSSCTEVLCKKPDIKNAYITRNFKEHYSHNDRVHFACMKDSERRFTVTCTQGVWTGIQNCTVCPKASVPHGFVIGPYNDILYYTCDEGYKLVTNGWWGEAKCNDQVWSGLEQCIEKTKCGEIPVIPNGEVTPQQDDSNILQIKCNEEYQAQADSITCHQGQWSSDGLSLETICTPIASPCGPPPKVENAVVVTSYQKEYLSGSEVTYRCRDKYALNGENTLRCKDGEWEEKYINCTIYCDKLQDVRQTMIFTMDEERYMNGDVIDYECITPEETKGTATCVDGKWTKTVECEAPTQEQ